MALTHDVLFVVLDAFQSMFSAHSLTQKEDTVRGRSESSRIPRCRRHLPFRRCLFAHDIVEAPPQGTDTVELCPQTDDTFQIPVELVHIGDQLLERLKNDENKPLGNSTELTCAT